MPTILDRIAGFTLAACGLIIAVGGAVIIQDVTFGGYMWSSMIFAGGVSVPGGLMIAFAESK